MAGGSDTKEQGQDQQCSECGKWYHWRGISEHEKDCNGPEGPDYDGSDIWDPRPDATREDFEVTRESPEQTPEPTETPEPTGGETTSLETPAQEPRDTRTTESDTMTTPDDSPEPTEEPETLVCPSCGGEDDIVTTDEAREILRSIDWLTEKNRRILERHDYYHDRPSCLEAWSE